jgi:uncharacterized protein
MDGVTDIVDDREASRFTYAADGHVAVLRYRRRADRLVLVHTGVPVELEGHGVGSSLVAAAVDRAEQESLTLVPLCPFARGWLERHPQAAARVSVDWDG